MAYYCLMCAQSLSLAGAVSLLLTATACAAPSQQSIAEAPAEPITTPSGPWALRVDDATLQNFALAHANTLRFAYRNGIMKIPGDPKPPRLTSDYNERDALRAQLEAIPPQYGISLTQYALLKHATDNDANLRAQFNYLLAKELGLAYSSTPPSYDDLRSSLAANAAAK